MTGWYYLHENKELIYKSDRNACFDIRESDLAIGLWPMDPSNREHAWNILVEAGAAGARPSRITELAAKWNCDNQDAVVYAERVGCRLLKDGDMYHATRTDYDNPMESAEGWGETSLAAMIELCKALGYKPSKMWGTDFKTLLKS